MESFLQSAEWQDIQERMGRKTQRLGSVLVIRHDLPLGFHYLYAPRPPELTADFFRGAVELAKKTGAIFLKIDPTKDLEIPVPSGVEGRNLKLEIRPSHSLQPPATIIIDCQKSDGGLFSDMHPKTRYNIRLAERHGVAIRQIQKQDIPQGFNAFWQLLSETSRRERFSLHPPEHYRILLKVESANFRNELWFAELNGMPLAAAIINWFNLSQAATYLHGASPRIKREVMAPYLLHWEIIRSCRARGFRRYDFGGIDEKWWPGVTRFKQGFGGEVFNYPPSQDIVFRPWLYRLYHLQHILRH